MVGDGHAMGVAAEILQHILGATEGTSQVDDPVLSKQWPEPSSEDLGFGEELQLFGEAELTILEGLPEGRDELATKELTQYRFGQEIVVRRVDPAGVIERETSGGHHTMDMRMNLTFWFQVCNTLKKPISAPRCLGSRATSRRVSALARNKRS